MSSRMTSCESVRALTDTTFALCVSTDKYREEVHNVCESNDRI